MPPEQDISKGHLSSSAMPVANDDRAGLTAKGGDFLKPRRTANAVNNACNQSNLVI